MMMFSTFGRAMAIGLVAGRPISGLVFFLVACMKVNMKKRVVA